MESGLFEEDEEDDDPLEEPVVAGVTPDRELLEEPFLESGDFDDEDDGFCELADDPELDLDESFFGSECLDEELECDPCLGFVL